MKEILSDVAQRISLCDGLPFVGRTDVLGHIESEMVALRTQLRKHRVMLLASGTGTGKSALLRELASRHDAIYFPEVPTNSQARDTWVDMLAYHSGIQRTLKLDSSFKPSFRRCGSPAGRVTKPTMLCIDNVHNLDEDTPDASTLIRYLYKQSAAPVFVVLAGQASAKRILWDIDVGVGISVLPPLSDEEVSAFAMSAVMMIKGALAKGLPVGFDAVAICEDVVAQSRGCPGHMVAYLLGVCDCLIAHTIGEAFDAAKMNAYGRARCTERSKRLMAEAALPADMLMGIYRRLQHEPLSPHMVSGHFRNYWRNREGGGNSTSGLYSFDTALHYGLLRLNEDGECELPVKELFDMVRSAVPPTD